MSNRSNFLTGYAEQNYELLRLDDPRFEVSSKTQYNQTPKPFDLVQNWTKYYKPKWIFFIDLALFSTYVLFAIYYQKESIGFTLDFSQVTNAFFTDDLELAENTPGNPVGVGQIYTDDDLYKVLNFTTDRLFNFANEFPCSYVFIPSEKMSIRIEFFNGTIKWLHAKYEEAKEFIGNVPRFYLEIKSLILSMNFHLLLSWKYSDQKVSININGEFTYDTSTDTFFFKIQHNRVMENQGYSGSLSLIFSIFIAFLNLLALIITIHHIKQVYSYCKKHNKSFWNKSEKWDFYGILVNSFSMVTSILFIFIGEDVQKSVPPILWFLSVATLLHSITLFKFLQLKQSTRKVLNVLKKGGIKIIQFLLGCTFSFYGAIVFSVNVFGPYVGDFSTPMQSATFLFCVMHGDSIIDFYTACINQNEINYWVGYLYATFYVLFAMTIIYNITISIVQEIFDIEEYKILHWKEGSKLPSFIELLNEMNIMAKQKKN